MKKFLIILLLLSCMAGTVHALTYGADFYLKNKRAILSGGNNDPLYRFMVEVESSLGGEEIGTGSIFYVDSNVASEGAGTSWTAATDTLDEAIALCTANNGDVIYVAQGHAESFTAANGFDVDVAGVTIIGLGYGTDMPEFSFTDTDGTVAIGAANVTIANCRFLAGISGVVIGVAVEAAGTDFTMIDCVFPEPTTTSFEFVDAIDLEALVSGTSIINCVYSNYGATGADHFVDMGNGVNTDFTMTGCRILGDFAVSAVWSNDIDLDMYIVGNVITNLQTAEHCIEFTANATGICAYNAFYTDAEGTTLDPGYMKCIENYVTTAVDKSAMLVPVVDDGLSSFNATTLQAIEDEATDALEADVLDKLIAADDRSASLTYPDSVANESILAFLMSNDASPVKTSYNNTTDSLEAIGEDTDTIIADVTNLYTTGAGTGKAPTGVTNESIIAFIMAKGATATAATFENDTDSLEAIRDAIDAYDITTQADVDAIIASQTGISAAIASIDETGFAAACTSNPANTSQAACTTLAGFGDDYFNTGWSLMCVLDVSGAGTAPEGEVIDITDYDSGTGLFTVNYAFTAQLTTGDGIWVKRVEELNLDDKTILGCANTIRYVDSGTSGDGSGLTLENAYATVALAEAACGIGDKVFIAEGHDEEIGDLLMNIANVTFEGMGEGDARPLLTCNDNTDEITLDAAGITVKNIRVQSGVTACVAAFRIEDAGIGCTLDGIAFIDGEASTVDEFVDVISVDQSASNLTVKNCTYYSLDATGHTNSFLDLGETTIDSPTIENCTIFGMFAEAPIWGGAAAVPVNVLVKDNVISNTTTGQFCIEFTGAATGMCVGNRLYADTEGSILDPGSMKCYDNMATTILNADAQPIPRTSGHINYLSDLTGAMGGGDYQAADDPTIFTVTGDILCRCYAIVNTSVTSASSDTLELGVTGDTACVLGQWAADGANGVANDVWTLTQDPTTPSADIDGTWTVIPNGLDIILTIDDHDITAGVIEFYLEWIALSPDASVVGAAP